jgi:murein DD-endopeptidase MepM/ murein hydrolase activator NlpD
MSGKDDGNFGDRGGDISFAENTARDVNFAENAERDIDFTENGGNDLNLAESGEQDIDLSQAAEDTGNIDLTERERGGDAKKIRSESGSLTETPETALGSEDARKARSRMKRRIREEQAEQTADENRWQDAENPATPDGGAGELTEPDAEPDARESSGRLKIEKPGEKLRHDEPKQELRFERERAIGERVQREPQSRADGKKGQTARTQDRLQLEDDRPETLRTERTGEKLQTDVSRLRIEENTQGDAVASRTGTPGNKEKQTGRAQDKTGVSRADGKSLDVGQRGENRAFDGGRRRKTEGRLRFEDEGVSPVGGKGQTTGGKGRTTDKRGTSARLRFEGDAGYPLKPETRNVADSSARKVGGEPPQLNIQGDAVIMGENAGVQTANMAGNLVINTAAFGARQVRRSMAQHRSRKLMMEKMRGGLKNEGAAGRARDEPGKTAGKVGGFAEKKSHQLKENSGRSEQYKMAKSGGGGSSNSTSGGAAAASQSAEIIKRRIKNAYAKAQYDKYHGRASYEQEYNKAVGNAVKTGAKYAGKAAGKAVKVAGKGLVKVAGVGGAAVVIMILLVVMLLFMFIGGGGTAIAGSYLSSAEDVSETEDEYRLMEMGLPGQIAGIETTMPGYDEYRYAVDDIGHDPYELLAYMTALLGKYKVTDTAAENALKQLFDMQYTLTTTPITETRYTTVTTTDPDTGDETSEQVPYDWYVLQVRLTNAGTESAIWSMLNEDQRELYSAYMVTKGNLQIAASPFDTNWLYRVSSEYGYQYDSDGSVYYEDSLKMYTTSGADVLAGFDGTVRDAGSSYVIIENKEGWRVEYGLCSEILASEGDAVTKNAVIAKAGDTMYLRVSKDGVTYNPLFFVETKDTGGGGLGGGGYTPVYGDPGPPMGGGTLEAFLYEAHRYLGYPYVWGGASPSTSFDCSGFVSYVINNSGYASIGWMGATDLYFLACNPIRPEEAMPGDLIFFEKTYEGAWKPISHVGIYLGDGMMVHSGKPNKIASINTPFFREHFFAFGRIKTGG